MARHWTFMTNHAHVLICLATDADVTLRQVGEQVGITERATYRIVNELVEEGVVKKTRRGRRNFYEIKPDFPLRHPLELHCSVGRLLQMVTGSRRGRSRKSSPP